MNIQFQIHFPKQGDTYLMLWSQIIYGHRTVSLSQKIIRFYGAAGRIIRFFYHFFRHRTVKGRYYLKFYGARTAFGRVIEGKMTSTRHLHTSDGHQTIFVLNLNRTIPTATVRAPYAGHQTVPGRAS